MGATLVFIKSFLYDIVIGTITDSIKDYLPFLYNSASNIINTKYKYKKILRINLRSMPFIYKDIDSDILNDYVEIESTTIDLSSLNEIKSQPLEVLTNKNKAIFFGSAGIGKTTFFRHSAISILDKSTKNYLKDSTGLLPVFIQLKAVSNFDKSPIIHYILNEISYFKGSIGFKRLLNLSTKHELFLLLDGYDEIGFVESTNFIKYELDLLLSPISNDMLYNMENLNTKYLDIYKGLNRCKVWLSTRKEFFNLFPLNLMSANSMNPRTEAKALKKLDSRDSNFVALTLNGLGEHRFRLIKIIFDKYKSKSKFFKENLDEEYFINDLISINDDELIRMSESPLFLTIMCYLYAGSIERAKTSNKKWLLGSNDLINNCIQTLLTDLDEYKVRDLGMVKKNSFLQRRSSLSEEKLEFLQHISLQLYINGINLVEESYLNQQAILYFSNYSTSSNKGTIVASLKGTNKLSNTNIVRQILASGLFILVPGESAYYDFPHRRFKETLAIGAIPDDKLIDLNVLNKNLSEFLLILFVQKKSKRVEILSLILSEFSINRESSTYVNKLFLNCLDKASDYDPSSVIENKLTDFINLDKRVYIWNTLLEKFNMSNSFTSFLLNNINNPLLSLNSTNLIYSILYYKDQNTLKNTLNFLPLTSYSPLKYCLSNAYVIHLKDFKLNNYIEYFIDNFDKRNYLNTVSLLLLDRFDKEKYSKFRSIMLQELSLKYLFYFLFILKEFRVTEFAKIEHADEYSLEIDFFKLLTNSNLNIDAIASSSFLETLSSNISITQQLLNKANSEMDKDKVHGIDNKDTRIIMQKTTINNLSKKIQKLEKLKK